MMATFQTTNSLHRTCFLITNVDMVHGRSPRLARWMPCIFLLSRFCAAQDVPALRLGWEQADHPSGVYHVKDNATLTVVVDNVSTEPAEFSGEILFGSRVDVPAGATSPGPAKDELKILSVT